MRWKIGLPATENSPIANKSSWRFVPGVRTCNVDEIRTEGERSLDMLLWLTLEEGLAVNVIAHQASVVLGRNEGVEIWEGAGIRGTTKKRNSAMKRMATLVGGNRQLEGKWRKVQVLWRDGTYICPLPR